MIKFDVHNRFTGDVQFTASIACKKDAETSWKLRLAVLWAVEHKANLQEANLQEANLQSANLQEANLQSANLQSANLRWANLQSANLQEANLQEANLRWANLQEANLQEANLQSVNLRWANLQDSSLSWYIQGPSRSDGYEFKLLKFKQEPVRIIAGCRNFTLQEARAHWRLTRIDTPLGNETFAILDCLEAMAKARGLDLQEDA